MTKLRDWASGKRRAKKTPVGRCISQSMAQGKPQDQAVAIALEKERSGDLPKKAGRLQRWAKRRAARAGVDTTVDTICREAKTAGATLKNDGRGGINPQLALKVFRRDRFTCKVPGCKTPKEKLDLDHIGGHASELEQDPKASAWLKRESVKGKQNTVEGLHVLCGRHHDMVHQRERAIDKGNQPPPMTE